MTNTSTKYRWYTKYKPSGIDWLGDIPEGWEVKRLKYVAKANASSLAENTDPEYLFKYLDIGNVGTGFILEEPTEMAFENAPSRARRVVKKEDTIISTVRTYLKAIYHFEYEPLDMIVSTGFAVVEVGNQIIPKYFYYLSLSECFIDSVVSNSYGVSYPAINESFMMTLPVWYPSIEMQQQIVAFLDRETAKIDEVVAKRQKLIELLKEKRKALITHAIIKGLDPKAKMKPSGIDWLGDIPEGWEVKRLNYLINNIVEKASDTDEDYFIVALENIESWYGKYILPENPKTPEGDLKLFCKGDVLFGKLRPYLAKAMLAEHDGLCVGEALVFRTTKLMLNRFLFYRLLTKDFINYVDASTQGVKMPRAEWDFIKTLEMPYPTTEEQLAIADFLDCETAKIDEVVKTVESQIEKLKEYRQALITSVVTGKIMVK